MSMWIGIEVEGKHKGLKTLFIEGACKYLKITNVLEKHSDIEQLYFGAGNCSFISESVVRECLMKLSRLKITLDVKLKDLDKIPKDIRDRVEFMLTITASGLEYINNDRHDKYQIKLQHLGRKNRMLIIKSIDEFDHTDVSKLFGKQYEGDVKI